MTESRREFPDPAALHGDIQRLCDQLHGLVENAAVLAGGTRDGGISIPLDEYEDLLKLASGSRDLLARSQVAFDDCQPGWRTRRRDFQNRILDDLAARDDLNYSMFCAILDNLDSLDGPAVPAVVGPAMLRAWIRTGDYSDTRRWQSDESWSEVREEDARIVLDAVVDRIVQSRLATGRSAGGLSFWIETVAPAAYLDGRERLEWLASHVAVPSNTGDLGDVGEGIREVVWHWYGDVDDTLEERLLALRAIHDIATSSSEPSGELYESLEEAWSNLIEAGPSPEDEAVIAKAVKVAVAESPGSNARAAELRCWVVAVAPRMYPDLADRLMWFAETVGKAAGDAPRLLDEVVDAATEAVCEWLDELAEGSIEDVAVVLRTFRRTPMGACVEKSDVEACLTRMAEAISA
ncbi:MAG: hypothetical protein Q8S73_43265 [Deltaproteobacteria bacterium]|nr:hypothetical protein [Myxococcales bacterium]MDP3220984.1 hypothetical protein [Deltaproteobacteria bacterium]